MMVLRPAAILAVDRGTLSFVSCAVFMACKFEAGPSCDSCPRFAPGLFRFLCF